jgi:imidazolonepropionase-like amidohydrolase
VGRLVLTNAAVVDAERRHPPGSSVVVSGGRIDDVVNGTVPVQSDDTVIDVAGCTVIPGMVQGHFHSTSMADPSRAGVPAGLGRPPAYQAYRAYSAMQTALTCGFTTVVSASCDWDVDVSLRDAIADGLVSGPRVIPCSRPLITTGDPNNKIPWYYESDASPTVRLCDGPLEFRHAVRDEIKRGAEFVKVYATGGHLVRPAPWTIALDELRAACDAAHELGVRVRAHVATKTAILACLDAGVDVFDHADGMDEECIERLAEASAMVLPSLYLPWRFMQTTATTRPPGTAGMFTPETVDEFEHMCAMLPRASAAGVGIAVGDDFGNALAPHGSYAEELDVYVTHAGVSALDVLRWATLGGAQLAGMEGEIGLVAPGYLADLVVVAGDPTADIRVLRDGVKMVVRGGEVCVDHRQDGRT